MFFRSMSKKAAHSNGSDQSPAADWRAHTYVAVDLETSGLNWRRDEILSYGAVVIQNGVIRPADSIYGLVHPCAPIPEASIRIHGLRAQDLRDAPPLSYCVETLDSLLRGSILVAHCASIERRFITRAFREHFHTFDCPVVDTAVLAAHVLGMPAFDAGCVVSLEYAAMALRLPVFTPHHALGDAMTTATLFLALANKLCAPPGETASSLLELGALD